MMTTTNEIADGIFRFSTFVSGVTPQGFTFNQFLIKTEEPLLFRTGPRAMFPLISEAVSRIVPIESLRWITFGHVEGDECGSMNQWLAAAPRSKVAHGSVGVMVSLNDLADRPPRMLQNSEVIDLGGKRVRHIDTPHVPHGWEARVLFEETHAHSTVRRSVHSHRQWACAHRGGYRRSCPRGRGPFPRELSHADNWSNYPNAGRSVT